MLNTTAQLDTAQSLCDQSDPVVLCTADERYAIPLAVTLRTAAESLQPCCELRVFLVSNGITNASLSRLYESVAEFPVHVEILEPESHTVDDLSVSHHISHTAYLRLLADRWLPSSVDKVIYLDSDLIVRESLTRLWDLELGNHACLAVPDIACPFIDPKAGCQNYHKTAPYLATLLPIRNYRELGLIADANYFNSGVMVMNIQRWREERLGQQMLDCLREHQQHVWCWDQYALNAVLHDHWQPLPMRWNVGSHVHEYPSIAHSPIDSSEFIEMLNDPAIIHFTSEFKPWNFGSQHPHRQMYFDAVDRTAWTGWRPDKPRFSLERWWQNRAVSIAKRCTISYRKLAVMGGWTP